MIFKFPNSNNLADASTIYYFFSTIAQVWAALVAFGAFAIRDRISQLDKDMDDSFVQMVQRLSKMSVRLRYKFTNFDPDVTFLTRESLIQNLDENAARFNEMLNWNEEQSELTELLSFNDSVQLMSGAEVKGLLRAVKIYSQKYKKAETLKKHLSNTLKSFLWPSLILITFAIASIIAAPAYWVSYDGFVGLAIVLVLVSLSLSTKLAKAFSSTD